MFVYMYVCNIISMNNIKNYLSYSAKSKKCDEHFEVARKYIACEDKLEGQMICLLTLKQLNINNELL